MTDDYDRRQVMALPQMTLWSGELKSNKLMKIPFILAKTLSYGYFPCDFISCNHLKADLLKPIRSTAEPFLEEINGIFIIN